MKKWILLTFMFIAANLLVACNQTSVSFTINFDSNGGTLVDPIKVGEELTITLPTDPEKEGFVFAGWFWDNNTFRDLFTLNSLQERGISSNLTVFAKWILEDDYIPIGSVKVTFNSNGGLGVSPVYVMPGNTIVIPQISREGYTLEGWYTSVNGGITLDERWSFTNNTVNNDITLYAKWNINQYTITFDSNGGTPVSAITQDYASEISISNPTRTGYAFDGWYLDESYTQKYVFNTMAADDITVYAKWNINSYTLQFIDEDNRVLSSSNFEYNASLSGIIPPTASKEGYTFNGWDIELPITMPASNLTLKPQYTINQYTISFDTDEGSIPASITQDYASIVTAPTDPTKEGHTFGGWYGDATFEKAYTFTTIPAENITIYAKWSINSYNVNYYFLSYDYEPLKDILLALGETIESISLGSEHSSAITSNGRIFTWGDNGYGRLGDGTTTDRYTPTEITSQFQLGVGETIESISLGSYHSSAITSTGRIFTWGNNGVGQLGDGTTIDKSTPTEISKKFNLGVGEMIESISLGDSHSSAITSTGRIFTWGYNHYGQLGDGTTTNKPTPTEITSQFNLDVGETIESISLGEHNSSAITSTGRIFTWGNNYYGRLGDGTTTDKLTPKAITSLFNLGVGETIETISLGGAHSSAVTSSGRIFTWGNNSFGQLGDGTSDYSSHPTPTEITSQFDLGVGERIESISLGSYHSSATTSTGRIFTWGWNYYGQLGDGTTTNKSTPTKITNQFQLGVGETIESISLGSYHSSAITSTGRIFTWGWNIFGQLGSGTTIDRYTPTEISQAYYGLLHSETLLYNQIIAEYLTTREGHIFGGWYSDIYLTTPYTFTTMPAANVALYGKWIQN